MPKARRGESMLMRLYAKNFVMAMRARDVIGAEVDDERITWRNGCNNDGISKERISMYHELDKHAD